VLEGSDIGTEDWERKKVNIPSKGQNVKMTGWQAVRGGGDSRRADVEGRAELTDGTPKVERNKTPAATGSGRGKGQADGQTGD